MEKDTSLTPEIFESYLDLVCQTITKQVVKQGVLKTSADLEKRVRELFAEVVKKHGFDVDIAPPAQGFPDIIIGKFGVEVKFTAKNTWRSVANSISEGSRESSIHQIYILFGKMGGDPEVKWAKYDDCVIHVRTSHVPRFEVEMLGRDSLFSKIGISYKKFSVLSMEEKMIHVRRYARSRLREDENFWWLERPIDPIKISLDSIKIFMNLPSVEKDKLFSEVVLLFPQLLNPRKLKNNFFAYSLYLLRSHGVFCPDIGMLYGYDFSPTSHEIRKDFEVVQQGITANQDNIKLAASRLPNQLFIEYWGRGVSPEDRIKEWLLLADQVAHNWQPSAELIRLKAA